MMAAARLHATPGSRAIRHWSESVARLLAAAGMGACLIVLILFLTPRTAWSWPLETLIQWIAATSGFSANGNIMAHDVAQKWSAGLLLVLLLIYGYRRCASKYFEGVAGHLIDAVAALGVWYLANPFLTESHWLPLENRWWPYLLFSLFFWIVLWFDERQARRLVQAMALLIAGQAFYAVAFYALDIGQFRTPHFGNRSGGTFSQPGALYPLCLLGAPLCLVLSTRGSADARWLWRLAAACIAGALICTFMRSGWIALAAALCYLALSARSPWRQSTLWRRGLLAAAFVLVLGAATWRTRGALIGNARDRSTLGRVAIWRVAMDVIAESPWLGSGVGSYGLNQRRLMTPQLEAFNPMNRDPKSLVLHLAAELGVVGLLIFSLASWRYLAFVRRSAMPAAFDGKRDDSPMPLVMCGLQAALIALIVAGLTDTPLFDLDRIPGTLALGVLLAAACVPPCTKPLAPPQREARP